MTPYQRQQFLNGLTQRRIEHKLANGGEITIRCPLCSPHHQNRRQTLCVNSSNDRWHCFRCEEFKGRQKQYPKLLHVLELDDLLGLFEQEEVLIEDDSLDKLRQKLLFGDRQEEAPAQVTVELPKEYRRDWDTTIIGRNLYRYLVVERKLDEEAILKYRIGYAAIGPYSGGIILPVYMSRILRFWQVRYVIFVGDKKYDSPKIPRRDVLFNYDNVEPENVVVVEGIFDTLALGGSTVGLLSKVIRDEQIALLQAKHVKTVTVMLDGEAWNECQQVAHEIRKKLWGVRLVCAVRLPLGKDPGKMGRAALHVAPSLRLRG